MRKFQLKNANLVDVEKATLVPNAQLYVSDGCFVGPQDASADIPEIDCQGKFIAPGIIDCHVHLVWDGRSSDPMSDTERDGDLLCFAKACANVGNSLRAGVTLVRDVGACNDATIPLTAAINQGYIVGSHLIPTGGAIQATYGHCPMIGHICDTAQDLVRRIKQLKAAYSQYQVHPPHWIKIMTSGGAAGLEDVGPCMYSEEELAVIVSEAHRLNMKVAAHALSYDSISKCVNAGIDTIEHGAEMTEEILQKMKANGQTWIPTLAVYKMLAESRGIIPDFMVDKSIIVTAKQKAAFALAMEIGVNIAMGSDAGSANFGPHPSAFREMAAMEAYGMPKPQVLRSATADAARVLGLGDKVGTLQAGKRADFVMLEQNPLTEGVSAYTDSLLAVYKQGELVK